MSTRKQKIRENFRKAVFERDEFRCVLCGFQSTRERAEHDLDAHHITPRELMPAGGYVVENGITLCAPERSGGRAADGCHLKAELALDHPVDATQGSTNWMYRYSASQLYAKICSSREEAEAACVYLQKHWRSDD